MGPPAKKIAYERKNAPVVCECMHQPNIKCTLRARIEQSEPDVSLFFVPGKAPPDLDRLALVFRTLGPSGAGPSSLFPLGSTPGTVGIGSM